MCGSARAEQEVPDMPLSSPPLPHHYGLYFTSNKSTSVPFIVRAPMLCILYVRQRGEKIRVLGEQGQNLER